EGGFGGKPDRSLAPPLLLPNETNIQIPDSTVTSATATTLTDTSGRLGITDLTGYLVVILSGPGAGQSRTVASSTRLNPNDATSAIVTLTFSQPWTFTPTPGSEYFYGPVNPNTTVDETLQADTLNVL